MAGEAMATPFFSLSTVLQVGQLIAVVSPTEPEVNYTCTFLFAAEFLLSASAVTGLFS